MRIGRAQLGRIIALIVAILATTAPAAELPPLEPTTPWRLDYADKECRAVRAFGSGAGAAQFQMNSSGPLFPFIFGITISGALPGKGRGQAFLRLEGDPNWTEVPAVRTKLQTGLLVAFPTLPPAFRADLDKRIAENGPIVLQLRVKNSVTTLDLQKMKVLMTSFGQCEDDLMADLGFDGPALRTLSARPEPIGSPAQWVTPADFPNDLLRGGGSGGIETWLTVDETGALAGCRVDGSIGDAAFEKLTCGLLKDRAHFQPARSASGAPIKAYSKMRILWRSGDGPPETPRKLR